MPACAFDELASTYDETFTDTAVARALRQIVWSRFEPVFRPGGATAPGRRQILELGCGTGEDAAQLARQGFQVTATDPSSRMIQVARRKAQAAQCEDRIEFHCLDMEQLGPGLDGRLFDGVLSNFGAINCVRCLAALVADVAGRLRPGGTLLWVIMGRRVPWEWAWYLMRGSWRKATRRYDRQGVVWRGMTITYPTPDEVRLVLQPYFHINRVAPLGIALPPSYAAGWLNRFPRALRALNTLELRAQRSSRFASWSDHYIVEAARAG